ncbi:hypothetical protein ACWD04_29885 [Streptomyces sp. NPDC002911]
MASELMAHLQMALTTADDRLVMTPVRQVPEHAPPEGRTDDAFHLDVYTLRLATMWELERHRR